MVWGKDQGAGTTFHRQRELVLNDHQKHLVSDGDAIFGIGSWLTPPGRVYAHATGVGEPAGGGLAVSLW